MPLLDGENWSQIEDHCVGFYGTWKQFQHKALPILLRVGENGDKTYLPM
jgi:hypothetical protein